MAEQGEHGAVAVETVFLTIFLLILVMGIVDVGRGIFSRISIEDAAQEAATYSSYKDPLSVNQIKQRAVDAIDSPQITLADVTVECTLTSGTQRDMRNVSVSVSFDQDLITPGFSSIAGPLTLSASATSERFVLTFPSGSCPPASP